MLAPRRAAAPAGALLLALTACSGTDDAPAAEPTSRPSTAPGSGAAGDPSTAPGGNAAPPSLEPDERDRAEVEAVRRWAEGFARAVNDGDRTFAAVAEVMTADGLERMTRYTAGDWGRYLPGPLPVAPVAVREVDEDHHLVDACVMTSGWSWASKADRTTWSSQVDPVTLHLVREAGRWLVEGRQGADLDCRGVDLPRRLW